MKKIIITFVFMLITLMSYAYSGASEFHKFNSTFTSRYKSNIAMMINIDEEEKDTTTALFISISYIEDLTDEISENYPIIIEYTDGTKEEHLIFKVSSSIQTYELTIYYINCISFIIDKNNFMNKSIKAIHILTNTDDVFTHSPSKSWYKNEREVKKSIIREAFDDYNNKLSNIKMFE